MRTRPSALAVASLKPMCRGAKEMSHTDCRESTRCATRRQLRLAWLSSFSSHTCTVASNEHVASTFPNSGCAHLTFQMLPECSDSVACSSHSPLSSWSQIRTCRSDEQVAILLPVKSYDTS